MADAASAATATTAGVGQAGPPAFMLRNARRRRTPEVRMSAEEIENVKKRVRVTLAAQHKEKTKTNYEQYLPPLHKWYLENRLQVCNERGIDIPKFYAVISIENGLKEEGLWFRHA